MAVGGIVIGCGGGGGASAPSGNAAIRSASIATYQSLAGGIAYPFNALKLTAPTGSGLANAVKRDSGLTLIPALNLYASVPTGSGGSAQINYFLDAAGTEPAGSMQFKSSSGSIDSYTKYPVTIALTVDVTGGNLPCKGSATITFEGTSGTNTMQGTLDLTKNNEAVTIDLALSPSDAVSGTMSIQESDTTINATNVSGSLSGNLTCNFTMSPQGYSGVGTLDLETSQMSLTFTDPSGATSSLDSSGDLVIEYPNGTSQTITNPLTATLLVSGGSSGGSGSGTGGTGASSASFATPVVSAWAPSTISSELGSPQAIYGSNSSGQVVGSLNGAPAFGSSFSATPQLLKLPGSTSGGVAYGINSQGEIAGFVGTYALAQAAFWGSSSSAPTLLQIPSGATSSAAIGINASGQMIGYAYTPSGEEFLYWSSSTAAPAQVAPGTLQGFSPSGPTAIDDQGHLFGAEDSGDFGFLWSSPTAQPFQVTGTYQPLGTNFSFSNVGLIGTGTSDGIASDALLWAPPSYQSKAIPVSSSATVSYGVSIDNAGDVVGDVYYGSTEHIAYWQPGKTEQLLDSQLAAAFPGMTNMQGQVVLADGSVIASGLPSGASQIGFYYFKRTDSGP
jgi:hypothetical protein